MAKLLRFWRDKRGAAVVEMAFIAPVIAGIAAVSFSVWDAASRQQDMRSALEVAVDYYMQGGADDEEATELAESAWRHEPDDADVVSERFCRCETTECDCDDDCPDGGAPAVYVRLSASGTETGAMIAPHQQAERVVRVQ